MGHELPKISGLRDIPPNWHPRHFTATKRPSAVLILFVLKSIDCEQPQIVLIRRGSKVGTHRGQIGFPGGRFESTDSSPSETSLRETEEELGIQPKSISIIGSLDTVQAIDGSDVIPIIGVTARLQQPLAINKTEVESVHLIDCQKFFIAKCRQFQFNMFGCWRSSYVYDCGTISVWGLSAQILHIAGLEELA